MNFYEHTLVARQNLSQKDVDAIEKKYQDLINNNSGKVIKIEKWGLLNLAKKIKRYKKGFYIHYKFEGNKETLNEMTKKIKVDSSIIRHLVVRYKNLDLKNESKDLNKNKKQINSNTINLKFNKEEKKLTLVEEIEEFGFIPSIDKKNNSNVA